MSKIEDINYNPYVGAILDPNGSFTQYGITLRDHLAGLAMLGLISKFGADAGAYNGLSETSYSIADAMLKARKETKNNE